MFRFFGREIDGRSNNFEWWLIYKIKRRRRKFIWSLTKWIIAGNVTKREERLGDRETYKLVVKSFENLKRCSNRKLKINSNHEIEIRKINTIWIVGRLIIGRAEISKAILINSKSWRLIKTKRKRWFLENTIKGN